MTHRKSASYRELASIPEDVFRDYFEEVRKKHQVPSSRGARSFAGGKKPASGRAKSSSVSGGGRSTSRSEAGGDLFEACLRCLGKIDVLVGKAKVKAAVRLDANESLHEKLRGKVLVVEAAEPEVAVRSVATQRLAGSIQEAVVLLPRDIDNPWLTALGEGPWSFCVPRESGSPSVAHIGGRAHGFALVFAQLGVVLEVRSEVVGDGSA